jgi:hypothetical protein
MSRMSFFVVRPPSLGRACAEGGHLVELLAGERVGADEVDRVALDRAQRGRTERSGGGQPQMELSAT